MILNSGVYDPNRNGMPLRGATRARAVPLLAPSWELWLPSKLFLILRFSRSQGGCSGWFRHLFIGALKQRFNVLLVRVVQWLFAVLAFATACHYSTVLTLKPTCTGTGSASTPKPIKVPISYPFRLLISASSRNIILCWPLIPGWIVLRHGHTRRCVACLIPKMPTTKVSTTLHSLATFLPMHSSSCSLVSSPGFTVFSGLMQ